VNQDITVGLSVQSVLKRYLGIKCNYVGYVGYDDAVWSCVRKREPFMHVYPSSHCALEIRRIADNIVAGRQLKIVNNCL